MGLAQCSADPSERGEGRGDNHSPPQQIKAKPSIPISKGLGVISPQIFKPSYSPAPVAALESHSIFFNSILHMWSPLSSLDFCHSTNIRTVYCSILLAIL